jgi:N-acetyltransferase
MNFESTQTYVLENDRVLLRPLQREDLIYLLPFSLNEPELWNYSLIPGEGEENLNKYIEHALAYRLKGDSYPFIVYDKSAGQYAGTTRFYDIQPIHKTVQLGYTWYGKSFQGTGLNKNCKYLLLKFAFETIGVERVEFRADHLNQRSIAAMQSIGCSIEGVLRSNAVGSNGRRDSIVLSILKHEWFDNLKAQLYRKISEN